MRLLKPLLAATVLMLTISPSVARPRGGGETGGTCQACNKLVGEDWVEYRCLSSQIAGRRECQITSSPYGCQESGDYCGWFFPSPNPVIM